MSESYYLSEFSIMNYSLKEQFKIVYCLRIDDINSQLATKISTQKMLFTTSDFEKESFRIYMSCEKEKHSDVSTT